MAITLYNETVPSASDTWTLLCSGGSGVTTIVNALYVANIGTSTADFYMNMTSSSASAGDGSGGDLLMQFAYDVPIPIGSTLQFTEQAVTLTDSQKLWVKTESGDAISVFASLVDKT